MTVKEGTRGTAELEALIASDRDFVRGTDGAAGVLEAEMTEAVSAAKGERAPECPAPTDRPGLNVGARAGPSPSRLSGGAQGA
jgi:transposase-like protein